jgi:integrase
LRSDGKAAGVYFRRYRRAKLFVLLALDLGLRLGDLLDLRWTNVNLDTHRVALIMKKTRRPVVLPISDRCQQLLEELRVERPNATRVVIDETGRPYGVQRIRRYFTIAKAVAGFSPERRLRIHDLRHTFGSKLARRATPLLYISKALGHSSPSVTARYARADDTAIDTIRLALNSSGAKP